MPKPDYSKPTVNRRTRAIERAKRESEGVYEDLYQPEVIPEGETESQQLYDEDNKPVYDPTKRFSSTNQPPNKGNYRPHPYMDYDDDQFYNAVYKYALQGATDREIAAAMSQEQFTDEETGEIFHIHLSPKVFHAMIQGNYSAWTPESNAYRSKRLVASLQRARDTSNYKLRAMYLKLAIGGHKVKSKTKVTKFIKIEGEDGEEKDAQLVQISETENELAPNLQAIATLLHHQDPEWRKGEGQVREDYEDDPEAIPTPKRGIDITKWIDMEVQDKEYTPEETPTTDQEQQENI